MISFSELSHFIRPNQRIWLYQFERSLNEQQIKEIENTLQTFVTDWSSHGQALHAKYTLLEGHYILISVDENIFDTIDLSIRQKSIQNRIILVLNPVTKEHWIYKRFFESMGVEEGFNGIKENVTYIHTSYLDNIEHLPKDYIADFKKLERDNPKMYNHVVMGC